MQHVRVITVFALFLMALCGCEQRFIERQDLTARAGGVVSNPPDGGGTSHPFGGGEEHIPTPNGPPLPYPTITKQTFIPDYDLWAYMKCHAWRIEWPNYPANTDPNKIPTVFSLSKGALNSFDYLNGIAASNTYKTHFNLYYNAELEPTRDMWDELTHTFGHNEPMDITLFSKVDISVKGLENMVKNRPSLFEANWKGSAGFPLVYQQGDVFLFEVAHPTDLMVPKRYGGIRIVSMTPRIIEVYLAVPNI